MGLSSLFKKKSDKEPKKEIESVPVKEPVEETVEVKEDRTTKTVVRRAPIESATEEPEPKKAPAKKSTDKKSSKTASKTAAKKAPAKKAAGDDKKESTAGNIPSELKTLNKQLKAFAEYSRLEFNAQTANAVFTEYMAKVFRDLRYRMLMIKDADEGIITMLGNTTDDISVKDKIVVKCVYMKKGSVTPVYVEQTQDAGALYHSDETWCITTTDFTDAAARKSRKQDAKVRLFDGKKLYKEFISKLERD